MICKEQFAYLHIKRKFVSLYIGICRIQRNKLEKINKLGNIQKRPTAQTAHLVFADTRANAEKTKRAVSCQRSKRKLTLK
jgi:hypothetical protein